MPRRLTQNPNEDGKRRSASAGSQRTRRSATKSDAEKANRKKGYKSTSDSYTKKPAASDKKNISENKYGLNQPEQKQSRPNDIRESRSKYSYNKKSAAPEKSYKTDKTVDNSPVLKVKKRASHAKRATKKPVQAKQSQEKLKKNKISAEMRNNFIKLAVMVAVGVGIIIGIYYGIQSILEKQSGFTSVEKEENISPISTQVPKQRNEQHETASGNSEVTPNPAIIRDISYGARDIKFKEKHINIPGIFDNEILFSAGSGSLYVGANVLSKLYLYNLDAGDETLIAESKINAGEFYETHVNHRWLVWLETDHGIKNYIMVMNRSTGKVSKLQSFKEGQPKLKLYGDLLVWMEQVSDTEDRLSMLDLEVQEFLPIHTFNDKATYGVSAPCVYENTIVWADYDPTQTEEDKANGENSAIYYLTLETDETGAFADPKYYMPGTYVHEPLYNGDVFVWLDANKSPQSNLFIGRDGEDPKKIATGVTTYSIGDGIVVYGKNQAVWVYIIATEELCRLTSPGEMGMLPAVSKRTVVWYNLSADSDKDVLRFIVLSDEELYPGGVD